MILSVGKIVKKIFTQYWWSFYIGTTTMKSNFTLSCKAENAHSICLAISFLGTLPTGVFSNIFGRGQSKKYTLYHNPENTHTHTLTYIYTHTFTNLYIFTLYIYIYIHICVYSFINTHTHTCLYTDIFYSISFFLMENLPIEQDPQC